MSQLRVLYFGTYDQNYLHNRLMIEGLRSAGAVVNECHVELWQNTEHKLRAARGWMSWLPMLFRVMRVYATLVFRYLPLRNSYDVMLLGYTGHFDVFPARLLTWIARRPLALDVLMSLYLIATERRLASRHLLRAIENIALRFPDLLLLDTPEYAEWFEQTYHISRERFHLIPLGADERIFKPHSPRDPDGTFRVLYYGTFIPLHGVEYIIKAADELNQQSEISFQLIGNGPERAKAEALTIELCLTNVHFIDWVSLEELPGYAAQADVLLGVFGTTEQSKRTVQNKIYQALAMAKPVITGDCPAVQSQLTHLVNVYLVERANASALAKAIVSLKSAPALRQQIAEAGYELFLKQFTVEAIGRRTRSYLEVLLTKH